MVYINNCKVENMWGNKNSEINIFYIFENQYLKAFEHLNA